MSQDIGDSPGTFVLLPGIPHRFKVSDAGPARLLQPTTPGQFREPAERMALPEPGIPDVERLLAVSATRGLEILPPVEA
jgi:hypothetical protein